MALKILCAGCSKDEREQAEAEVGRALADRAASADWSVSLVKLAGRWSITLDAPAARIRGVSAVAVPGRLGEAIREALGRAGAAPAPAAPAAVPPITPRAAGPPATSRAPAPASAASGGRLRCEKCGGGFVVVYEARGESLETAPVACPHCWHVNRVMIDADAAFNRDYRAEKA